MPAPCYFLYPHHCEGLREKIVTVACSAPAPAPAPAPPANSTKRRRIETTQGGDSSRATPSAAAAAAATAPAIFSGDPLTGRECVDIEFGSFLDVAAAAVACNEQHQLSADLGGLELYLCQCPLWTAEAAAAAAAPTTPTPTPTPSDGARQLELPLAALLADIRIPPCVDKDSLEKINIWIGGTTHTYCCVPTQQTYFIELYNRSVYNYLFLLVETQRHCCHPTHTHTATAQNECNLLSGKR